MKKKQMTVTLQYDPAEGTGLYPFVIRFGRAQWKLSAPVGQMYKAPRIRVAATLGDALGIIGQEFEKKS